MTVQKVDIQPILTDGFWDIAFEGGDIKATCGLDSAVYVSLLTDARASADLVFDPQFRRGWLGNVASPVEGRDLGGLLWLVDQARLNQDTLNNTIDWANKSLAWFVDDALLVKVVVTGEIVPRSGINLKIQLTSEDGSTSNVFVQLWRNTVNPPDCALATTEPYEPPADWILASGTWSDDGYWRDDAVWIDNP